MRTSFLLLVFLLTASVHAQTLTSEQRFDPESQEFRRARPKGQVRKTRDFQQPDESSLNGIPVSDFKPDQFFKASVNRNVISKPSRRSSAGRTQSEPVIRLKKSALVKVYNKLSQTYEEKYRYNYRHESDSSYWMYTIEKDEEGKYTDTVSYEYYQYHPSKTLETTSEYKNYQKYGGQFYLQEWSKDLAFYTYEDEYETGISWFHKYDFYSEYEFDEGLGKYYLTQKQERTYDNQGNQISAYRETFNASGISEGWKEQTQVKTFADGSKEYNREFFEYDLTTKAYRLSSYRVEAFNDKGNELFSYSIDWNNDLGKMDSSSVSKVYYDTQGRQIKSIHKHTYNAATNSWVYGNRYTWEYLPDVTYEIGEWLNNGQWTLSQKATTTVTANTKDVVVSVWNDNSWSPNIKWAYQYYDNKRLKGWKLYLWSGSTWYISEYSQYQFYEYNSQGKPTLFERYSRYDRSNTYKIVWEYDAQNRPVKVMQYNAYTNNMNSILWDNAYETTYSYGIQGNQSATEFRRWMSGNWVTIDKRTTIMDPDGNELEFITAGHNWDTGVQQWGMHLIYTLANGDFETVCPKPIISLTGEDTGEITLTSSSSTGNQWFKDGVVINSATKVTYTTLEPGTYTVKVSTENCANVTSDPQIIIITGLESPLESMVKLYPNPAQRELVIDPSSWLDNRKYEVSVFDASGKQVDSSHASGILHINIDSYRPGNYWIRIRSGKQVMSKQIIKR